MISETPKASKVVCTKQPETKPKTVANPDFVPLLMLWVSTKILSGPGEMAKAKEDTKNPIKMG
jgi:hypothetical protein